jgi:hypothetical protein
MIHESDWYKKKNAVGWRIAMNTRIGSTLQVTATLAFDLRYDW